MKFNELIPISNVEALGLGVGRRTIGRLIKNPESGFPPALNIRGRLYVEREALEQYKARLIAQSVATPKSSGQEAA